MNELTKEILVKHGFKKINNSMWRLNNITLQPCHIMEGKDIYEKMLSLVSRNAYKVCVDGKYKCLIENEQHLKNIIS